MAHTFKLDLLRGGTALVDIPEVPDDTLLGPPVISRGSLIGCINDVRVNFAKRESTFISGETDPFAWDSESDRHIDPEGSCNIAVVGEGTPFQWEIKAAGFWLDAGYLSQSGETAEVSRTLYCDEDAYGSCAIKVTDKDGLKAFGYVTCTKEWR